MHFLTCVYCLTIHFLRSFKKSNSYVIINFRLESSKKTSPKKFLGLSVLLTSRADTRGPSEPKKIGRKKPANLPYFLNHCLNFDNSCENFIFVGEGQLEISINDGDVPNAVQVLGGGKCLVTYTPEQVKY